MYNIQLLNELESPVRQEFLNFFGFGELRIFEKADHYRNYKFCFSYTYFNKDAYIFHDMHEKTKPSDMFVEVFDIVADLIDQQRREALFWIGRCDFGTCHE